MRRLALIAALALAGCGGSGEPSPTPAGDGSSRTPVAGEPSASPHEDGSRLAVRPVAGVRRERAAHAATALPGGRVLVTGGCVTDGCGTATASTELYAPVLVCGGAGEDGRALASADVHDPATDRWSPAGRLAEARTKHAAVRLPDGRVLVVGGAMDRESRTRLGSTGLYHPAPGRFTPGPRLRAARYKLPDAVVALADGRVVVAGDAPEVEIVDPARGRVTLAGGDLGAARAFATATRVGAEVLVLGGYDERIAIQRGAYLVG